VSFVINPNSPIPIYRQIVDEVRRRVAGGHMPAGEELPSVRAVAQQHAINPMTVSKAYSLLEAEGLLERRRGMGMVVAASGTARRHHTAPLASRLQLLQPTLLAAAQQAAQLGLPSAQALALFERCLAQHGRNPSSADDES
jgi:GntR family transcriptional regulator